MLSRLSRWLLCLLSTFYSQIHSRLCGLYCSLCWPSCHGSKSDWRLWCWPWLCLVALYRPSNPWTCRCVWFHSRFHEKAHSSYSWWSFQNGSLLRRLYFPKKETLSLYSKMLRKPRAWIRKKLSSYREFRKESTGIDPFLCSCGHIMEFVESFFPAGLEVKINETWELYDWHRELDPLQVY